MGELTKEVVARAQREANKKADTSATTAGAAHVAELSEIHGTASAMPTSLVNAQQQASLTVEHVTPLTKPSTRRKGTGKKHFNIWTLYCGKSVSTLG